MPRRTQEQTELIRAGIRKSVERQAKMSPEQRRAERIRSAQLANEIYAKIDEGQRRAAPTRHGEIFFDLA